MTADLIAQLLDDRVAQGLPSMIEDPLTLARVAALLATGPTAACRPIRRSTRKPPHPVVDTHGGASLALQGQSA